MSLGLTHWLAKWLAEPRQNAEAARTNLQASNSTFIYRSWREMAPQAVKKGLVEAAAVVGVGVGVGCRRGGRDTWGENWKRQRGQ